MCPSKFPHLLYYFLFPLVTPDSLETSPQEKSSTFRSLTQSPTWKLTAVDEGIFLSSSLQSSSSTSSRTSVNFLSSLIASSSSSVPHSSSSHMKENPPGYCAPYNGNVCKKFIPPATFVYYNLTTVSFSSLLISRLSALNDNFAYNRNISDNYQE